MPINGLVFASDTAGPAFQASLPGKNNFTLVQDIIFDRTDIETGFVTARLAPRFIDLDMGPVIDPKSYPG